MTVTKTTWAGLTEGQGLIQGKTLDVPVAIPEGFGGNGKGSNPKDLLTASAASCYVMTLAIMLQSRKIPASNIYVTSELTGDKPSDMHISHSVKVLLSDTATQEQLHGTRTLITAADTACMIGNLLKAGGMQITVSGDAALSVPMP